MKNEPLQTPSKEQSPAPASLDEVRRALQSYGYLNRPIERFYLRSIKRGASQLFARLILSFRVGLLTGTIASLLLTAGTLLFNEHLLARKADLVVLFFYFELFFVALFTILEFLLIYAVGFILSLTGGRRLLVAGQAISFLVGLAFFVYFFHWGRSQYQYLQVLSAGSIAAMLVILIVSCIFVAKCAWLGFLVAFRESDAGHAVPNWRRYAIEVSLSLAAILILLPFVGGVAKNSPDQQPPSVVFPTKEKWIVLGVDGISSDILQRFVAQNSLPNLQRAMDGSFGASLQTPDARIPPVIWTTIATGVPPAQHGIRMPEVRRWGGLSSWVQITPFELAVHSVMARAGLGQRQPVSGYLRKVKPFWEILSDNGIRVGVVNWWGSWPAVEVRGWNVSERYYYKLVSSEKKQDETFPAGLFARFAVLRQKNGGKIDGRDIDRFYMEVFRRQLTEDPVRVAALYLPGLDILNYEFFEAKRIDPFAYTGMYETHLRWLDSAVGQILSQRRDYQLLLILHQGRSIRNGRSMVILKGAGIKAIGLPEQTFSEIDIAPLLLYSCGVPLASEMNTDLIHASMPQTLNGRPAHYVQSYPARNRQVDAEHADEFNDVLVEQMKSLGYLQ